MGKKKSGGGGVPTKPRHWIANAVGKHPGLLTKKLGGHITEKKLQSAVKRGKNAGTAAGTKLEREALLAERLRSFHHTNNSYKMGVHPGRGVTRKSAPAAS
jgi:hypothetical protein